MLQTVKELCALRGVSSFEDEVREYIRARVAPYADEMTVDVLGNLIVRKKGARTARDKLMLCAHMDEVGLIVREITDDGYLKFATVGGIDRRVLLGKRVYLGKDGVLGVVGIKAVHLTNEEERKKVPKLTEFYIDIGARDRAEAEARVAIGEYGAFDSETLEFGNGLLKAKAIDDRVGCAAMIKLIERDLPMDCTFVFTVQEEVGLRGAFGAAFAVTPEIALVLEGTTAADIPTLKGAKRVCAPGAGVVVPFMDGGTIYDRGLFELLRTLAEENGIAWQTKRFVSGGTDGAAIQRTKSGVRVAGMAVAVRYLHAPSSVANIEDFNQMLTLAERFIEAVAQGREE